MDKYALAKHLILNLSKFAYQENWDGRHFAGDEGKQELWLRLFLPNLHFAVEYEIVLSWGV